MLPKVNRLKKENDFSNVLRAGRKIKGNSLILKFRGTDSGQTRFGVAVSKKVSKKATVRNKIRRRMLAVCGMNIVRIKKNIDVVLLALPGMETKNFSEIKAIIENTFSKAGITPAQNK